MIRQILRIRAVFVLATKRLLAQPLLAVATIVGLTVAVALILTIPVYSESVAFRILSERLVEQSDNVNRPPFSYLISYIGSWNDPVNWEDTVDVDRYIRERAADDLGLNATEIVRHFETRNFRLYTADETAYEEDNALDFMTFSTTEDIFNQVEMVEGTFPAPADPSPDSIVEVMIARNFADEYGIQVGDRFLGFNWRLEADEVMQITEIRIAGVWQPLDPTSPYWFYLPLAFEDTLIVNEATYVNRISPYTDEEVNLAVWYVITDGRGINTNRVGELIDRENTTEMRIDQLLPGTTISSSPISELRPYQRIVSVLTLTLTVFSVPIVALLIVFLMMIVGLIVDRQRNETAMLRSRGTSPFQIVGLAAVEGFIFGGIALIIGTGLAVVFTRLMGSTKSFLDLGYDRNFIVSFPPTIVFTAIIALLFTVIIRLLPTISASRHTIVSYKISTSHVAVRPLLQRLGVDLLLLVVIGYFYYQTVQQGGLINIEGGVSNIDEAYNQPFVFLLPPLTIFGTALLVLRILPYILRFISWLIYLTDNVGLLIVTRQLERSPRSYYLPLILLISTISLGIYTSSFARTIDRYLYEQQFYRVAADVAIRLIPTSGLPFGSSADDSVDTTYVPIAEFRSMQGIEQATRLGEYQARARLTTGSVQGTFIGVDRTDFGSIAFWRSDFASTRLGYLLNNLAIQPDSVLASREFMRERGLDVGDFVDVDVSSSGETISLTLQIVGEIDHFPRWYAEEEGALFVGNLDYLFEQARIELPHLILARINSEFDENVIRSNVLPLGISGIIVEEPVTRIEREQARPERQGLFGLLSIGFIASSLATMIGFLLYTIFSYQRRYVELGTLRAIGLSQPAMMLSIAWELGLLILVGLSFGVFVGITVSAMYIPYMQFVSNLSGIVPPYLVTIAWSEIAQIVASFMLTFVIIMVILMLILRRMRIFQAVKLGEVL
ncbi:MAG: ABC transporter permease [Aggregatilineales bacterium]